MMETRLSGGDQGQEHVLLWALQGVGIPTGFYF